MKIFNNKMFMYIVCVISAVVLGIGITFGCLDLTPRTQDPKLPANSATAPNNSGNWTDSGNYDIDWKGDGTESDPYLIETERQLAGIAYEVNNNGKTYSKVYFEIENDLDLSDYYWYPIGYGYSAGKITQFDGNINGKSHTITNLFVKRYYYYYGLSANGSPNISNLGIVNLIPTGMTSQSHKLYAFCSGGTIENCFLAGSDISVADGSIYGLGGSTVVNSFNLCNFETTQGHSPVYGITSGTAINCFNVGTVRAAYTTDYNITSGTINNCYYGKENNLYNASTNTLIDTYDKTVKLKSWFEDINNWNSEYPWDFNNIWTIDSAVNDGFPSFKFIYKFAGEGTEESPYQISNAEDLRALSKLVNAGESFTGVYFKQTADLNMGGKVWMPIGASNESSFCGNYDGGNFTISSINTGGISDGVKFSGLFGLISGSSNEIKNIHIRDSIYASVGTRDHGSIVGFSRSSDLKIKNCSSNAIFNVDNRVGGIISTVNSGSANISNCYFSGSAIGQINNGGGIVGLNNASITITNCQNLGNIYSTNNTNSYIGGIMGQGIATIENCISRGTLTGRSSLGSIAGYFNGIMKNCAGYGTLIVGDNCEYFGSIVGATSAANISNCSFNGGSNRNDLPLVYLDAEGTTITITSCYALVNGKGIYSTGDFSGYTIVANMNNDLPMQNELFAIAIGGNTSEEVIDYLISKGFSLA